MAGDFVICGSRDVLDRSDVFRCFDRNDGSLLWQYVCPAAGRLDYGNSPRATPVITGEYVVTLGAFGHLTCLELESGIPVWQISLTDEYETPELEWGFSGTPLVTGSHIILQTGDPEASLVCLDLESGDVVWESPGAEPSYSSFVLMEVHGQPQLIGYDTSSLGGWDPESGIRLWTLRPPIRGDFNVPTVVPLESQLLVASENNGTRLYDFRSDGTLNPEPVAVNRDLAPDSHSPVVSGKYVFGVWGRLYQLDAGRGLATVAELNDEAFLRYASLIASDSRVLVLTERGELVLMSSDGPQAAILSRLLLTTDRTEILSHPAISGSQLFVRIGTTLGCLSLSH